jgi:hypothetical protein
MNSVPRARLNLECLDDRLVPSAAVLDLTTSGAEATAPSGAIVEQVDPQPMGTGYIHAFVRIQAKNGENGIEQGYNTDGRPLQFDEKTSPAFTRSITFGQVPEVTVNGGSYFEFLLDINQDSNSPLLSLDEVQIFLGSTGNLLGYDSSAGTLAGLSPVFDLNSGSPVEVLLNARLSSGLGSGDMALFVPAADFAGASPSSYLYLYSHFGNIAAANGGYEQWAVPSTPPSQLPPPVTSISGAVLQLQDGSAVAEVTVELQGTDINGNTVILMTQTGANGAFSFNNLAAGTYTIIQETFQTGESVVNEATGTINGQQVGMQDISQNEFLDVAIASGQSGVNYIFYDGNVG